ncbi:MAG: alpha-L-fucosidase [bacterium]
MNLYRFKAVIFGLLVGFIIIFSLSGPTYAVESIKLEPADTMDEIVMKAVQVTPSARQLEWQKIEFAAFLHFGVNTFTNKEWGDGAEDEKIFNPTKLDARQWVGALKDAGVGLVILTAKHHDGFCLWPSKYTEHSVKNSAWKDGKGDVVREVADAAREAGMKFGVYLSPWDRHEKTFGTPEYNTYYLNQLHELLTNYGEISEVWMDGACGVDLDPRCKSLKYDFDSMFKLVRTLAPNATIAIYGPDVRWVGNEAGKGRESEWSVVPDGFDALAQDIGSREKLLEAAKAGKTIKWYPAEVDVSIRTGWFYHKFDDFAVKSLDHLLDIYYDSVGGNAQLLLNVPPDNRGLFNAADVKVLKQLGKVIKETFKTNLALGSAAKSSSSCSCDLVDSAAKTTDGDTGTYWTTDDGVAAADIEYDLGAPKTFDVAMLQEYIKDGQRVEEFYIDALDGSDWKQIAGATTIGYKKLLRFNPVTARKVRLRITKSRIRPTISEFGLFVSKK